jgi:ankyrin repeat protein
MIPEWERRQEEDCAGTRFHQECASGNIQIVRTQCRDKHNFRDCPAHRSSCENCIDNRNSKGITPFMIAARFGHFDVMKLLMQHGADINAVYRDTRQTSFHRAIVGCNSKSVNALLQLGVNTQTQDNMGTTPLMECISLGWTSLLDELLEKTTDVNVRDHRGNTALHFAASHREVKMLKSLVNKGADLNAMNYFGLTPLMRSAMFNKALATEILIHAGAELDLMSEMPIISSRGGNQVGVHEGRTALHFASQHAHFAVIQILLERGASEWKETLCGATPLDLCKDEQLLLSDFFGPSAITPDVGGTWCNHQRFSPERKESYRRSVLLLQQAEMATKRELAIYMSFHPRIGMGSGLRHIDPELMRRFIYPQTITEK